MRHSLCVIRNHINLAIYEIMPKPRNSTMWSRTLGDVEYLSRIAKRITNRMKDAKGKASALNYWLRVGGPLRNEGPCSMMDARRIIERARGGMGILCSERAPLLIALCESIGIKGRLIYLRYESPSGKRYGHFVAELLVDGKWVVYDPTYSTESKMDNYYRDAKGRPLSSREIHKDPSAVSIKTISYYRPAYSPDKVPLSRYYENVSILPDSRGYNRFGLLRILNPLQLVEYSEGTDSILY